MNEPDPLRVLILGCGRMGKAHARACHKLPGFQIAGLVSRNDGSREALADELGGNIPVFNNMEQAVKQTAPEAVSINTYPDTHAEFALQALDAGAHVFVEKPLADSLEKAERVLNRARETGLKLVVGYILHHHPSYVRFLEMGRALGKPLVMRMNLNQQSAGLEWERHKQLIAAGSPITDGGVHYVDLMCQATKAKPMSVHAIGARLSDEIPTGAYNYGHLHVTFDDGSVGWYESGWGPMINSETHSVREIIGPRGSIRLENLNPPRPTHQDLCENEQAFFLRAIREDMDLREHHEGALTSLRIVLAAQESIRTGSVVSLL